MCHNAPALVPRLVGLALCIRNVDFPSCRRQAFHMKCQRQIILGIRWFDHIANQAVSNQTGLQPVSSFTRNRCVALFGHIAKLLPDNVPAHQALLTSINLSLGDRPSPDWRPSPGRPPNIWLNQIRTETGSPPAIAWRNAIRRGHHPGATQRPQLATRQ